MARVFVPFRKREPLVDSSGDVGEPNELMMLNALADAALQPDLREITPPWVVNESNSSIAVTERIVRKKQLSPTTKCKLYNEIKTLKLTKKNRHGKIKELSQKYGVCQDYPKRLMDKIDSGNSVVRKSYNERQVETSSRAFRFTEEKIAELHSVLEEANYNREQNWQL